MSKKKNNSEYLNTVIIGSGLSALNFIDTFKGKGKEINVISPNYEHKLEPKYSSNINYLPSQMRDKKIQVENFFLANNLVNSKKSKIIGSLDFGGLSNYWGLQMDNYITFDDYKINKKTKGEIFKNFIELITKYNFIGKFKYKNKIYKNDFKIPDYLEKYVNKKINSFVIKKPILAFSRKINKNRFFQINEKKDKCNSLNFLKKIKKKKKIRFHNFYLEDIEKYGKKIKLFCKKNNKSKTFIVDRIIFAAGTIATTKILMKYLNIKSEVKVNHHPRLISVYLSKHQIKTNLKFTPSLLQIIGKIGKNNFSADLRPGNKLITDSIIELSSFLYPFKFLINLLKDRLIFSNILLAPKFSDIYIKNFGDYFQLYTKKNNVTKTLSKANKKFFSFLFRNKIVFPFFKTHFPGIGADFHYFGTLPINSKNKLSVNENCQLKNHKNIYVIDSSIFNFKSNRYPLGIVMANARRIGKLLS